MMPEDIPSKIPTQLDVANLAGVSRTTVSFVLNNREDIAIPDETRQRVWDAVAQLGYAPNRAAQTLRTQKTFTVAGIIEDITNPFHPAFERGIQVVLNRHDYDLIMYNTDGDADKECRILTSLQQQRRVDGIIGSFYHAGIADFVPFVSRHIPVVRLNGPEARREVNHALDTLIIDNTAAAREAVEYLISKGHRRISMLAGVGPPREARVRGYREALANSGIAFDEHLVRARSFKMDEGQRAMQELLATTPRPTAVFAASDLLAMGAMIAIREAGLRIPDDIAIVGFDDIFAARALNPPLTTVAQFQHQLGEKAAELLLERLTGQYTGPGRQIEMPYELIIRETA